MSRKYDTLAISFLMFTAVLSVWLGLWGPTNATAWKDWQPLMAATLALGGAGIVYRGATLAYKAAMTKIDLDKEQSRRNESSKAIGILLRLDFALLVLAHEAAQIQGWLKAPTEEAPIKSIIANWKLTSEESLEEAWTNLDIFPYEVALRFNALRARIYNFSLYKARHKNPYEIKFGEIPKDHASDEKNVVDIVDICKKLRESLKILQKDFAKRC